MKINIAIDGFSSCGKSSTAKQIAKKLQYKYIDTGAMYRAYTLYFLDHNVDWNNAESLQKALPKIQVDFRVNEALENRVVLNGKDVEKEIRTMRVSEQVSPVSTVSVIRKILVEQQRKIADGKGVVMDGRDIGTVVLPNAELKVFMTASIKARTERRWLELKSKGIHLSPKEVQENLEERDHIDSTRKDSPLKKADDAELLDTSDLEFEEQVSWVYEKARLKMNEYQNS